LRTVFTFGKRKCNQENWDFLDKTGWSLGTTRVSFVSGHPWVWVRRTWRRSSVNLHGGFDESSPYWRLIHLPQFWEPMDDLVSTFHGHFWLCIHFERLKDVERLNDVHFLDHPEELHARL
jgi:hypothetical protein